MPLFIGKNIIELSRVDSTNNYLKELLNSGEVKLYEGTVVKAFEQYSGRGQQGSGWDSEPGKNLTFSILLQPNFLNSDRQFYISKVVSLAVSDTLGAVSGRKFHVKWPNDILFEGRKISGILIENNLRKTNIQHSIAGMGININQVEFPAGLKATSMRIICQRNFDTDEIFKTLCSFLEQRYLQLRNGRTGEIDEEYHLRLYGMGKEMQFRKNDNLFTARIMGVVPTGELHLKREGRSEYYRFKEVEMIY